MNLISDPTTLRIQSEELTLTQRAEAACTLAAQFEKVGEYEAAREALRDFWPENDEIPNLAGLDESAKAEMLLRCGALARCAGGAQQVRGNQERAKNLITQAI